MWDDWLLCEGDGPLVLEMEIPSTSVRRSSMLVLLLCPFEESMLN
jgi:hypothetical protein